MFEFLGKKKRIAIVISEWTVSLLWRYLFDCERFKSMSARLMAICFMDAAATVSNLARFPSVRDNGCNGRLTKMYRRIALSSRRPKCQFRESHEYIKENKSPLKNKKKPVACTTSSPYSSGPSTTCRRWRIAFTTPTEFQSNQLHSPLFRLPFPFICILLI